MKKSRYFLCRLDSSSDLYKIKVNFYDNEVTGIIVRNLNKNNQGFMLTNRGKCQEVDIMGLDIVTIKGTFTIECECIHNVQPIYL